MTVKLIMHEDTEDFEWQRSVTFEDGYIILKSFKNSKFLTFFEGEKSIVTGTYFLSS